MKRDDTKKNFTSLSGNDLQTVRLHYPSFPCIIAIVPVSRLLNLMRYSSVLNANIRFFCSENRNFTGKNQLRMKLLFTHFMPYQRRTKMKPRIFSSNRKATHMPQIPQPKGKPKRYPTPTATLHCTTNPT